MINLEIAITLVAMLVAFFIVIYLLQKGRARKQRIKKDFETLELAKQLKCDTREPENQISLGLSPFNLKSEKPSAIDSECKTVLAFGLIIFSAFLAWSVYLIFQQFIVIAAFSIVFALLSVVLLIAAKSSILKGRAELFQLRTAVDKYEQEIAIAPTVKVVKPAEKQFSADVEPVSELYENAQGYDQIPEDSMLKRHFLSNLISEVEASFATRPTDSTLKRHHDAMIRVEFERRLMALSEQTQVKVVQPVMAKQVSASYSSQVTIPEDSTLRRHFLTQLRSEIEAGYGPRPTDSALKRHFDSMVNTEFERRVEIMSSVSIETESVPSSSSVQRVSETEELYEHIPEDSMLRRHFMTLLRSKIEAKLPQRPTDFNLLRHYRALVESELEHELEEHYYF